MPFRALRWFNDRGHTVKRGDIVPGAGEWPNIMTSVRTGQLEPVRALPDGTFAPVRYRIKKPFGQHQEGSLVDGSKLHGLPLLLLQHRVDPVLEDAADPPADGPAVHQVGHLQVLASSPDAAKAAADDMMRSANGSQQPPKHGKRGR